MALRAMQRGRSRSAYADLHNGNRQATGYGLLGGLFHRRRLGRAAVLQHAEGRLARDCVLSNRIVIGAVADTPFPSFQNRAGISIGGISILNSPTNGPESCSETMLSSGTVRGRIGYAPGNSLFDATGGFAWTYDQLTLTQLISGTTEGDCGCERFG